MRTFLTTLILCGLSVLFAQKPASQEIVPASAMESSAVLLGTTPPLRNLVPRPTTPPEKKAALRMKRPPRNFVGRGMPYRIAPGAQPQGEDPVRQSELPKSVNGDIRFETNIPGLSVGGSPHDPSGDVGRDYYVQAVNVTTIGIYNKDGSLAREPFAANTLWAEVNRSSAGDPIILYDQAAERWIITEFPPGNELLFAVSDTPDPLGSYNIYVFGTPNFPDYPKYSVWNNAYVVTTNEEGTLNQTAYFINRDSILNGADNADLQRILVPGFANGPGFFVGTPVDWSGMTPPAADAKPMIMRQNDDAWGNIDRDAIELFEFDIDWADADSTKLTMTSIFPAAFDTDPCSVNDGGFSCAPQLDGIGVDAIPAVIMNQVHYQNFVTHESIVLCFITDVTGGENLSGIRWMELRRSPGGEWELYQEGTFAPDDGLDRYMCAIAQDTAGNIAIAYSASSEEEFISLRAAGRFATDPLGVMTQDETLLVEGENAVNSGTRYGDYAQMAVDPFNGQVFWFTSEYPARGGVDTRIASFRLRKAPNDLAAKELVSPGTSSELTAAETVFFRVRNSGLDTARTFQVGYRLDGGETVVETVNVVLPPDSNYIHAFATPADLETIGDYQFELFTDLNDDEADFNDTLICDITRQPQFDAGLATINGVPSSVCGESVVVDAVVENFSGRILDSIDLVVSLDGNDVDTVRYYGPLAAGALDTVSITVMGLTTGDFVLGISTLSTSDLVDEVSSNDSFVTNLSVNLDGETFFFALQLDNFPQESRWDLINSEGVVVAGGNNYSTNFELVEEALCLDPTDCYTVRVFDSFGDGIFFGGGFTVTDSNGEVIADENGDFAFEQTAEICGANACLLEVTADVVPASAVDTADGTIMLTLDNTRGDEFTIAFDGDPPSTGTVFTDLLPGSYEIVVSNGEGCEVTLTVEVRACSLAATATVRDSTITVEVTSGAGNYTYSIDGVNFQRRRFFRDVDPGNYDVYVRDDFGCILIIENVRVDFRTDVFQASAGQLVTVYPNPNDGVFRVELSGLPARGTFLPVAFYDASGRLMHESQLVRYDDTYQGHFSLRYAPNGVYYLRILDDGIRRMLRIVKE